MMAPEMIKRTVDSLLSLRRQNNVRFSSKTDDILEEEYQLPLLSPSPPTSLSWSSNIDYDDDKYLKIEEQKQEQDRKSLVLLLFLLAVAGLIGTISCFHDEIIVANRRRSTTTSYLSSSSSTSLSDSIINNNHDDDGIIIKQKLSISTSSTDTAKIFEEEVATPAVLVHRRRGNSGAPTATTTTTTNPTLIDYIITKWKKQTEMEIIQNVGGGIRWIRPYLLPPTDSSSSSSSSSKMQTSSSSEQQQQEQSKLSQGYQWLRYGNPSIPQHRQQPEAVNKLIPQHRQQPEAVYKFEKEWDEIFHTDADHHHNPTTAKPVVVVEDYRDPQKKYDASYPQIPSTQQEIAVAIEAGFETIENRLKRWPPPQQQNSDIIINHNTFKETLHHLDYQNPQHRQLAKALQQADLPYKLINVPEVVEAGKKWSDDEYVANELLKARYFVEESPDNFFLHDYIESSWDVESMGLPLIRRNYVMPYKTWSKHAKYADATQLPFDKPHFDLLAAAPLVNRNKESFFSRELPSFMSDKTTFFVPNPAKTGKRTCRFSERGSMTNIHMESTGNHIAMVSGAQRVLITPPNQCPKLGIRQYHVSSSSSSSSSSDEHHPAPCSMLNLGHMSYLLDYYHRNNMTALTITTDDEAYIEDGSKNAAPTILPKDRSSSSSSSSSNTGAASHDGMSKEERYWLQKAGHALSVETVLKEGEVLFIPSYWPSYTISLQKSAQCTVPYNTAAGDAGSPKVGGGMDAFNQCNRYL